MAKKKYYVVWDGVTPGVYESWKACQQQILGYPGARYKSFKTKEAAHAAYYESTAANHIGITPKSTIETISEEDKATIVWDSIAVDAACSGNPGVMEYQGVDTQSGYRFFHQQFNVGTNNIGEFLALVHALALLKREGRKVPVYSDSKIAIGWVKAKKCRSKLKKNIKTTAVWQVIERAETWLKNNTYENELLKWNTKKWGEIPADFGRK